MLLLALVSSLVAASAGPLAARGISIG